MFSQVTLQNLIDWTQAKTSGSFSGSSEIPSISSDSRNFKSGEVFIALKGENFDGHHFLDEAASKGALALIGEKKPESLRNSPVAFLEVPNTLHAYVKVGEALRNQFKGKVLAVTGSAGKSSTKDMAGVLLGPHTLVSPKSFNNLLGVSKTLCLLEDTTQNLILEMGMNGLGEIREMCEHFSPQGGVITNIGDAHIGKLGGREGIYRAKKELFDSLEKDKTPLGIAVNLDDPWVVKAASAAFSHAPKILTYSGKDPVADIFISKKEIHTDTGALQIQLRTEGGELSVTIPHFGMHHAYNVAAAIALARLADTPWEKIKERLSQMMPSESRGVIVPLSQGRTLIDECYNSNPSALISSLESVMALDPQRKKILVIGEMRELEDFSSRLHEEVGEKLGEMLKSHPAPVKVFGVGKDTQFLLKALQKIHPQISGEFILDVAAAQQPVIAALSQGDVIFVKGSRGVALDQLVTALKSL